MKQTIFDERLDALERNALPAIVPGEIPAWCEFVTAAIEQVADLWDLRCERRKAVMSSIRDNDAALHARVDRLENAESSLVDEFAEHRDEILTICDNEGPEPAARAAREDLLGWIQRLRAHDGEIATWAGESVYRDRGGVGH